MKKIVTLIIFILLAVNAQAQSEQETLAWLKVKTVSIAKSYSTYVSSNIHRLDITDDHIKDSGDDAYTQISWSQIRSVELSWANRSIKIISDEMHNGAAVVIQLDFYMSQQELATQVKKALEHMATLKGAKLVNDDLFK
jgi:hypothetical protein